jgi:hypothetical protein
VVERGVGAMDRGFRGDGVDCAVGRFMVWKTTYFYYRSNRRLLSPGRSPHSSTISRKQLVSPLVCATKLCKHTFLGTEHMSILHEFQSIVKMFRHRLQVDIGFDDLAWLYTCYTLGFVPLGRFYERHTQGLTISIAGVPVHKCLW